MNILPLKSAVLCGDCDCISDTTTDACPVCGSRVVMNLANCLVPLPPVEERASASQEVLDYATA